MDMLDPDLQPAQPSGPNFAPAPDTTRSVAQDWTPRHTTGSTFTPPAQPPTSSPLTQPGIERPRSYSPQLTQTTGAGGPAATYSAPDTFNDAAGYGADRWLTTAR